MFLKILNFSGEYVRMENVNYNNKSIERKYLNNMRKNQFLKVENSLSELEKIFYRIGRQRIKR